MSALELYWQDALTFAVLGLAVAFLAIRVYRGAVGGRNGASCGACPANPENRTAGCARAGAKSAAIPGDCGSRGVEL